MSKDIKLKKKKTYFPKQGSYKLATSGGLKVTSQLLQLTDLDIKL